MKSRVIHNKGLSKKKEVCYMVRTTYFNNAYTDRLDLHKSYVEACKKAEWLIREVEPAAESSVMKVFEREGSDELDWKTIKIFTK